VQLNPVLIQLGPISIYWYGVLIVAGAMLAAHIASKLSSQNGHDPEIAWNLLLIVLIAGVLGARIYHVISLWSYYRVHPGEIFGLQMSGFGIYGAVMGGAIGVWGFAKYHRLRFLEWMDYVAPGLILAQAIGRWGNFFNQELYGYPTDLPWGIYIAPEHRLPGFESFERFHPTFLYESLLNLAGFAVLIYLAKKWRKDRLYGDIFFLYGLIYATVRFFIEFQRPDAWKIGGIPTAQWISIISVVFFGSLLLIRRKLRRPSMIYVPGTPWQSPEEKPAVVSEGSAAATMGSTEEEAIASESSEGGSSEPPDIEEQTAPDDEDH
jgi:phosphatidylglycerol:prolipoprotein diacylglycerol transferase